MSRYPDAYSWVKTPNTNALAREGVRFRNAYMTSFCVPSQIRQLTGNLPHSARGTYHGKELSGKALSALGLGQPDASLGIRLVITA